SIIEYRGGETTMSNNRFNITRRWALALGAAAMMAPMAPATGFAQDAYPSKNITFICAFPAGSGADILVRYFAEKVAPRTGQTIRVEHLPGAAGSIAAEFTARAPTDGHTILVHSGNSPAGNMWLLKIPPIDPSKDLQ